MTRATVPSGARGHRLIRMEELDRQIVELLVKDGRMSYTDLGKATGLSTSAVRISVSAGWSSAG